MNRRKVLGALAAASTSGCLSLLRSGRKCPELDDVEGETICSNRGSLYLKIEPGSFELPATATFTVVNEREREFSFHTERPVAYRNAGSDWREAQHDVVIRSPEPITVSDRYSYELNVPFGESWAPQPGEYLFFVPGWMGDSSTETVLVGEFVEIEA